MILLVGLVSSCTTTQPIDTVAQVNIVEAKGYDMSELRKVFQQWGGKLGY